MMSNLAIVLAVSAAASWAIGMTAAKPGVRHMDFLSYILIRWVIVAVLAAIYAAVARQFFVASWVGVAWAAVVGLIDAAGGGVCYLMAMQRTPAHQTTALANTAPLWGVIASVVFLAEPVRWSAFVAAALVVLGAYFLIDRGLGSVRKAQAGPFFAFLTGILWGVAETVPSKLALTAGLPPIMLLLILSSTGVIGIALVTPFLRPLVPRRIDWHGMRFVLISAVPGAFLGWVLWLNALKLAPASTISPVRGATMLFAFLYSILFLHERPKLRAFLGVGLIFGGVLLISIIN
jgi:drug/metabolite transporter (DMT)-like permease